MNKFCLMFIAVVFFSSCSNLKYLPEGEKLYTGANVKLNSFEKTPNQGTILKDVKNVIQPEPNSKVLGLRIKCWCYNIAGKPTGKGFRYWLKNSVGEPPVLLSSVKPLQVSKYIDSRLFNNGIFRATTEYKIVESKHKAKIDYQVSIHAPYTLGELTWPSGNDDLSKEVRESSNHTILKKGNIYNLSHLNEERARIDELLKEKGYFYFNAEYILFSADTSAGNNTVNLTISIKDNIPHLSLLIYHINNVFITPDFSLKSDSNSIVKDTTSIDNVYYIAADHAYRPKVIIRSVFLRKNEIYSRTNHNMTLNRLMGMGGFKFVNIRFNEEDSLTPGNLNVHIDLTPLPRKSIRSEIEVVSKSNNFLGPSVILSYNNRNAFNGAELLELKVHASFETQINGQYKGLFSYNVGSEINLHIPKFILPFKLKIRNGLFIPKTRFTFGYDFESRVQYFTLNSFKFIYGYRWKQSLLTENELNPININYSKLSNESANFRKLLDVNILLRKSFEEQFIAGLSYSFTYNQQILEKKPNQTYFNLNVESSGNSISIVSKNAFGKKPNSDKPLTIAGAIYSQFIRADVDLRHFRKITSKAKLAGRIYAGAGWAYGNSITLPFVKQFFSGGANSVRAFRARSIGPGTTLHSDSAAVTFFFDQGGDIKLEANAEFRFNIISILKGALFTDAGNTWLLKENSNYPGGKFKTGSFLKEFAVGTGFGLRLDANFFVLRFDFAFPLRKPWLPSNQRWVYKEVNPLNGKWRKDNLILNIAIGYPF